MSCDSDSSTSDTDDFDQCSRCGSQFIIAEKGCSALKLLCEPCHTVDKEEVRGLFDEDSQVVPYDVIADATDSVADATHGADVAADVVADANDVVPDATDVADVAADVVPDATDVADVATDVVADATDVVTDTTDVVAEATDVVANAATADGNGDVAAVDYLSTFVALFKSSSESLSVTLAGCEQCFVHKPFMSDPNNTPLKLFIDLEVHDKCGLLYHYILLSAHYNRRLDNLSISRAIVEDRRGQRFYVGCLLRTKCVAPRYDAMLLPLADGTMEQWFRVQGISKFKKEYRYLPLEFEDHDRLISSLGNWFEIHDFTYVPERGPNKDETGSFVVVETDGWDQEPSEGKRKGAGRRTKKVHSDNSIVVPKVCGRRKKACAMKKAQELVEKISSKKPKRSKVGKYHDDEVITIEDRSISHASPPTHQDGGIPHPPPPLHQDAVVKELMQQLKESQAMCMELRDEMKQIVSSREVAPSPVQHDPSAQPASIVGVSEPPVPPTIPVARTASLGACDDTGVSLAPQQAVHCSDGRNSFMLMSTVQDQTDRLHRLHDAEKKNILYENLVLQNYFK